MSVDNQTNNTGTQELSELSEGYYRWCMETVAKALGSEPILGTGSAKPLNPTEFEANVIALINTRIDAVLDMVEGEVIPAGIYVDHNKTSIHLLADLREEQLKKLSVLRKEVSATKDEGES